MYSNKKDNVFGALSPGYTSFYVEVINMSSLLVGELKDILENVPEDYEVIMEIRTGCDMKAGTSIAYINGVKRDDEFKEIKLMN